MQLLLCCEASFAFDIAISGVPLFRMEQIESRTAYLDWYPTATPQNYMRGFEPKRASALESLLDAAAGAAWRCRYWWRTMAGSCATSPKSR